MGKDLCEVEVHGKGPTLEVSPKENVAPRCRSPSKTQKNTEKQVGTGLRENTFIYFYRLTH